MTPFIDREPPEQGQEYKFVRAGNRVAYDTTDKEHLTIASEHDLGKPFGARRIVDDGGHITRTQTIYKVGGRTHSCELKGRPESTRKKTLKVIEESTGVEAKHTSFVS